METISYSTPKAQKEHKCDWCDFEKFEILNTKIMSYTKA